MVAEAMLKLLEGLNNWVAIWIMGKAVRHMTIVEW